MTPLHQWANRWQIHPRALSELLAIMGAGGTADTVPVVNATGEAAVQQTVRLTAARNGSRMWRNNVGLAYDDRGVPLRFGLANDSVAVNKVFKSSDLIGITPVVCKCGHRYGVFTAYECKHGGWKYRPSDKRATAQLAFINFVISMGGIAKFVTGPEDI